jgi:hypothetical protein
MNTDLKTKRFCFIREDPWLAAFKQSRSSYRHDQQLMADCDQEIERPTRQLDSKNGSAP